MSFPRYPKYKASGVEWLGKVPEHWEVTRLKNLFSLMKRQPEPDDDIVTAFRDGQVTLRINRRVDGFTNALQEHGYQRVLRGDLVIHAMDAFAGAIGVADSDGKSTPVYSVCAPKTDFVSVSYFGRLLRHMALSGYINSLSKGIRERSTEFRWAEASNVLVSFPPLLEQTAIAAFLDRETGKIDALMAEQRRLMELLKEKRQAVISHAVTRGLNPKAPLKDSGIDWLGQVPAHWEVKRFQRCVYVAEGQVDPENPKYSSLALIAPNHIESGTGRLLGLESASDQGAESGKYLCKAGDVVYSKIRPALRKVCIAPEDSLCSADMYPLRSHSGLTNPFLLWTMLSEQFSAFAVLESQRVAMPKINRESLKEVMLAVPPLAEQDTIVEHLKAETAKFDTLTDEAQRAIDLLQERRTALISAAVTGQIDIRKEVAA